MQPARNLLGDADFEPDYALGRASTNATARRQCMSIPLGDASEALAAPLFPQRGGLGTSVIVICFWGPRDDSPADGPTGPPKLRRPVPWPEAAGIPTSGRSVRCMVGWGQAESTTDDGPGAGRTPLAPRVEVTEPSCMGYAATTRCRANGNGHPGTGGLWAGAGQRARWWRIFSRTAGCSVMEFGP